MKNKSQESNRRISNSKGGGGEGTSGRSKEEPILGSLIWIKLSDNTWWPAQVVDEKSVSESNKPDGRLPGDVLVRLYGSYQYYYVDPTKYLSEFGTVLQKNNGSYLDVFRRALEQDVPTLKSGRSKEGGSKHKGEEKSTAGASKNVMSNRRLEQGKLDLEDTTVRQATVATPEMKTKKHKGRTAGKDKLDDSSDDLVLTGTSGFQQQSVSHRLKSRSRTAAEKAKVRISRQVQAKPEHDVLQKEHLPRKGRISDEDNKKGTAESDGEKKKRRWRNEGLKDQLAEHNRTLKPDSKKPKISSAKKEGKSEVPKLEESEKKEKPVPTPLIKPEELSMRRLRVMKTLGLIGPSGSPFHKNGRILVLD